MVSKSKEVGEKIAVLKRIHASRQLIGGALRHYHKGKH